MFDGLLAIIAPHVCIGCGIEGSLWCQGCRDKSPAAIERCYRCHALSPVGKTCRTCRKASPLYQVQAATRYETEAKRLIWKLKFERARVGAHEAADLIATRAELFEDTILFPALAVWPEAAAWDLAARQAQAVRGRICHSLAGQDTGC